MGEAEFDSLAKLAGQPQICFNGSNSWLTIQRQRLVCVDSFPVADRSKLFG